MYVISISTYVISGFDSKYLYSKKITNKIRGFYVKKNLRNDNANCKCT